MNRIVIHGKRMENVASTSQHRAAISAALFFAIINTVTIRNFTIPIMARRLQSLKALKMTTWQAMSRFIRARDKRCVTCGGSAEHAGHYKHNSERSQQLGGNALWFDARNISAQCVSCNTYRAGNLPAYAIYLEEKYGHGILQELNKLWLTPKKWTRQEIEAKRTFYNEAFNSLALQGLGVIKEYEIS